MIRSYCYLFSSLMAYNMLSTLRLKLTTSSYSDKQVPAMNLEMDFLNSPDCSKIVKRMLNSSNFECVNVEVHAPTQRSGFLGDHFKITLHVRNKTEENKLDKHQKLGFFAKVSPQNREQKLLVEDSGCFEKEALFYRFLASEYETIGSNIKMFPKCYLARNDIIILEDLSRCGFKPGDAQALLDLQQCKQALHTLACLHASHFIVEEKLGFKLKDICPKKLRIPLFLEKGNKFSELFGTGLKTCVDLTPVLPKYKSVPSVVEKVQSKLPRILSKFFTLMHEDPEARNVFCHGDLWASNMMFKYDEEGHLSQVALVDFQTVRLGAPASDVMPLLYLSTSRALRQQHLDTLLAHYYDTFAAQLQRHHLNVEDIMSRGQFQASCAKHTTAGLLAPAIYYQVTHFPKERMARVMADPEGYHQFFFCNRTEEVKDAFETDAAFRKVMNEAMENLIDALIVDDSVSL